MDWLGILAGLGLGCAGLALGLWAWTLLLGRIGTDEIAEYRRSAAWHALLDGIAARRGYRCAACGVTYDLHGHHWTNRNYGFELPWQVLYLCERQHLQQYRFSVHWWSAVLFGSRNRGVWFTTALVVGVGKAKRLGRRAPQTTTGRRAA